MKRNIASTHRHRAHLLCIRVAFADPSLLQEGDVVPSRATPAPRRARRPARRRRTWWRAPACRSFFSRPCDRGQREPRARHAQRMAERDGAAMGIDLLGIVGEAELAQAGERLRGEGLVELDHIEVADLEPEPLHQLAGRRHRADAHDARRHRRPTPCRARARAASRPWRFTAASQATIMAAAPSLTPEALPAVTVPGLRNAGLAAWRAARAWCPGADARPCRP